MNNNFEKFYKNQISFKHWKVKDTYLTKVTKGNWWSLKKYIVIYADLEVNRETIDDERINNIYLNFKEFVKSINDKERYKEARKYFLDPFGDINERISFDDFNDAGEKYEDFARKFYTNRLLNQGGASGLKKNIKEWVDNNKSMSEIICLIDDKKDYLINHHKIYDETQKKYLIVDPDDDNKFINGIIHKGSGEKINLPNTLSDFTAGFSRNDRALFGKWGFLPPEEDGLVLNEISNAIYQAKDEIILASICDHQKLKLRVGCPYTPDLNDKYSNPQIDLDLLSEFNDFNNIDDFLDYKINPYIALLEIFNKLHNENPKIAYITKDEYQFIISRLTPFNLDECVHLIKDFRKKKFTEDVIKKLDKRQKRRAISKKGVDGGFLKEITNHLYGFITKKEQKNDARNQNHNAFIEIKENKFVICNSDLFNRYFKKIIEIKDYLESEYRDLYETTSKEYSLQILNEMTLISKNKKQKDNLEGIRKNFVRKNNEAFRLFLNDWHQYFSSIDADLLEKTILLNQIAYPTDNRHEDLKKPIINISRKDPNSFLFISPKSVIERFFKQISKERQGKKLIRESSDFNKLKKQIENQRKKGIYHRKKFNKEDYDKCDLCINKKQSVHHLIPVEIGGPDHELNLTFLCKECHDIFTNDKDNLITKINELKKLSLISNKNYQILINKKLINQNHLDYLLNGKYINFVEWIDLKRIIKIKERETLDKEISSTRLGATNSRWARPMRAVFKRRIDESIIMGKRITSYNSDKCDSCSKNFNDDHECHHMIPKSGSTSSDFKKDYGDEPMLGPESEFNYLYLCSECHKEFTHHSPKRKKSISNIVKKGLVTYETVFQMVVSNDLNERQLNFLLKEGFINKNCHKRLIDDYKTYSQNST